MTPYQAGQVVGTLIGLGLAGLLVWWAIRGTKGGKKLELLAAEVRIADIYAECKQIKFGGFVAVGAVNQGRLILTNQRLLYTNPHEKRLGLALLPSHILTITKGSKGPMMTLELDYMPPGGKSPKHLTFMQLGAIPGVKIDPKAQLPIGMFIDRLLAWKAERAA
jgi:hypothetical protein